MIKLFLEKLVCHHDWEEKHTTTTWDKFEDKQNGKLPISRRVIYFCKNVVKLKKSLFE